MEIEDRVVEILLSEAAKGTVTGEQILEQHNKITADQLHYHFKFAEDEYWIEGQEYMGGGFLISRLTSDGHRALAQLQEALDQVSLSVDEARLTINGSVQNLQINSNAIGIQITDGDIEKVKAAVDKAEPDDLKRAIMEWIPTLGKAGIEALVKMLGG